MVGYGVGGWGGGYRAGIQGAQEGQQVRSHGAWGRGPRPRVSRGHGAHGWGPASALMQGPGLLLFVRQASVSAAADRPGGLRRRSVSCNAVSHCAAALCPLLLLIDALVFRVSVHRPAATVRVGGNSRHVRHRQQHSVSAAQQRTAPAQHAMALPKTVASTRSQCHAAFISPSPRGFFTFTAPTPCCVTCVAPGVCPLPCGATAPSLTSL